MSRVALLLLALVSLEAFVFFRAVQEFGFFSTLWIGFLVVLTGASLVQWERARTLRKSVSANASEQILLGLATALFWIPGFVSDAIALLLLLPFVRRFVAGRFAKSIEARVAAVSGMRGASPFGGQAFGGQAFGGRPNSPFDARGANPNVRVHVQQLDMQALQNAFAQAARASQQPGSRNGSSRPARKVNDSNVIDVEGEIVSEKRLTEE